MNSPTPTIAGINHLMNRANFGKYFFTSKRIRKNKNRRNCIELE